MSKKSETIPWLVTESLRALGDRETTYVKEHGVWKGRTSREGLDGIVHLALALDGKGLEPGDRVALLCGTRPEWLQIDLAILSVRCVTIGVYETYTPDQIQYILDHSGARFLFIEGEYLESVLAIRDDLSDLESIICIDPPADCPGEIPRLTDWVAEGRRLARANPDRYYELLDAIRPDDLATIIYTSGTTGPPKGAMLTHGNIVFVIDAIRRLDLWNEDDIGVVFLPFAHALQRVVGYAGLVGGVRGAFAEKNIRENLLSNWQEIRPTVQPSVPRIWEKFYGEVISRVESSGLSLSGMFYWAMAIGHAVASFERRDLTPPVGLRIRHALADLILARIRRRIFGGRVRYLTSGGAPIAVEILEFFHAMGILILEGYGLTETAAPATMNLPNAYRFGTVGRPLPGVEVRIADDGEIEVNGPNVFQGYYRDEAATKAAFTDDGWFRTGDLGELSEDGFLRITGRKKDLIITSTGKNVSPQNLETLLVGSPIISQAMVIGDGRSYLTAILTLDEEVVRRVAREQGLSPGLSMDHPAVREEVQKAIDGVNEKVARNERIRRFRIVSGEWTIEDGSLTPTLKVKRRVLNDRYRDLITQMYEANHV